MKNFAAFLMAMFLSLSSCQSQEKKEDDIAKEEIKKEVNRPEGTWKVEKEFDENGNLIRYDSIYSWSSHDSINDLTTLERDSLLNNFESRFYRSYSQFKNQGFEDIFEPDSLFTKHFFDDDFLDSEFGMDFIELDKIQKRMIDRQKKFLEKYRSDFIFKEQDSL